LEEPVLTLYKKAVCAEVDYFALNGFESVSGGYDRGFTVGKVSVSGKTGGELKHEGAMNNHVSPLVLMYLEQTGLLNPAVPVVGGWVCCGRSPGESSRPPPPWKCAAPSTDTTIRSTTPTL
jgi:hypothetical protein